MKSPKEIVDLMYNNDDFSQWLGIERINDGLGTSTLRMKIRKEMTNGFNISHGGIVYSFADSAFAFASNSHGRKAVSIETSISHTKSLKDGDEITARAVEKHRGHKTATYFVDVVNQNNEPVALFRGTVYIRSETW